jgi:hypothetical protein
MATHQFACSPSYRHYRYVLLLLLLHLPCIVSFLPIHTLNMSEVTTIDSCPTPLAAVDNTVLLPLPRVVSVRPNSTTHGSSVVLEIHLSNAPTLLKAHGDTELLVIWTAQGKNTGTTSTAPRTVQSKRFSIVSTPTNETFNVAIDFQGNKTIPLIPPLWQRSSYFFVRLVKRNTCEFTSAPTEEHSGWPAPCGSGEYLKVLRGAWFDHTRPVITAVDFLDFSYRPLRTDDASVMCLECPRGLDCSQSSQQEILRSQEEAEQRKLKQNQTNSTGSTGSTGDTIKFPAAGFHGGIGVQKGYWRVDWSPDAENTASRCRNQTACVRGGRCLPGSHRTGPLCEVCQLEYGMRAGGCVPCNYQDYVPLIILGSIIFITLVVVTIFRKRLHELRNVWWSIGRIFKVIIDCSQITSAMPLVLGDIYWPDSLLGLFSIMDLSTLDFTQYIGLSCINGRETSYYQKSSMLLSFLVISVITAILAYRIMIWYKRNWWNNKADEEEKEQFITEVLEDVFEVADIDDNGKLNVTEAIVVAKHVGNKKIAGLLVGHMHRKRNIQKKDSITLDGANGAIRSTRKRFSASNMFTSNETRKKMVIEAEAEKKKTRKVFLRREEFVKFMRKQDNIGDIVLRAERAERLREIMTLFTPFLLILHTPITARVFALFTCDDVGGDGLRIRSTAEDVYDGAGSLNGDDLSQRLVRGFLPNDYKLACMDFSQPGNPAAVLFYIVCFLFLGLVTVGMPLGLVSFMCLRRNKFYEYGTYSELGFLYERFKKGSEFADMYILIYKTMLCAFIVFLNQWPRLQRVVGLSICMIFLTWFAWTKPMRNPIVTKMTLYGFCVTAFMYASTQIFAESGTDETIIVLFVVLIFAFKIGLLVVGIIAIQKSMSQARKTLKETLKKQMGKDDFGVGTIVVALGAATDAHYTGTIRYIGSLPDKTGEFIGLELQQPNGKNNGLGKFVCKQNHGLFVKRDAIVDIVRKKNETKATKRRSEKHALMQMLSSTIVVPLDAVQVGKLSPAMMEREIMRLQKQAERQEEEIGRLSGILGIGGAYVNDDSQEYGNVNRNSRGGVTL